MSVFCSKRGFVYTALVNTPADQLRHFQAGELIGYADRILDRLRSGAAVTDDADTVESEKRSSAVFIGIAILFEFAKSGLRRMAFFMRTSFSQ